LSFRCHQFEIFIEVVDFGGKAIRTVFFFFGGPPSPAAAADFPPCGGRGGGTFAFGLGCSSPFFTPSM
jgi:hypothetical protein